MSLNKYKGSQLGTKPLYQQLSFTSLSSKVGIEGYSEMASFIPLPHRQDHLQIAVGWVGGCPHFMPKIALLP